MVIDIKILNKILTNFNTVLKMHRDQVGFASGMGR